MTPEEVSQAYQKYLNTDESQLLITEVMPMQRDISPQKSYRRMYEREFREACLDPEFAKKWAI